MKKTIHLLLAAASWAACGGVFAITNQLSFETTSKAEVTKYFSVTPTGDNKLILNMSGGPMQFSQIKFDLVGGPLNVLAVEENGNRIASFNDRTNKAYSLNANQTYTLKVTAYTNELNAGVKGIVTIQSLAGNLVTAVPEPESYAMLLAGLGLMGTVAFRRKKST